MEKMYEIRISENFSIEANSKQEAIEQVLENLADWLDVNAIQIYEY